MRDFVLDDDFLLSCVDLHKETREKILSQLRAFSENPRDRDLGVARVEGQKDVLSLPVDGAHCIFLRRVRSITTLLFVTETKSASTSVTSKRSMNTDDVILASVHALETLLVEEKYLPLARHLLKVPAATAELQFHFKEIEEILNLHLPPEARQFVNWWANQKSGKRAHAFAWMAAGRLIPKVDIKADRVTFKRRGYVLTRFLNSSRLSASSPVGRLVKNQGTSTTGRWSRETLAAATAAVVVVDTK